MLRAFNHESVPDFLNRCFRIVNGIADEADFGKVMVHACIAHVMKSMKNDLKKIRLKHKASQNIEFTSNIYFSFSCKSVNLTFMMYCFSLLVNSWSLDVFTKILTLCNIVFSSKYLDQAVREAEEKLRECIDQIGQSSIFLRASTKYAKTPRS